MAGRFDALDLHNLRHDPYADRDYDYEPELPPDWPQDQDGSRRPSRRELVDKPTLRAAKKLAAGLADDLCELLVRDRDDEENKGGTDGPRGAARRPTLVLRRSFLQVPDGAAEPMTPMVQMLGPTKGWARALRLKTYLTLLWFRLGADPHGRREPTVDYSTATIAALLGVPGKPGIRHINDAIADLADLGYLDYDRRTRRRGGSTVAVRHGPITVNQEDKPGIPHTIPVDTGEPWFAIGEGFWTDGWIQRMPGNALAVLLVLLARFYRTQPSRPIWVAGTKVHDWHAFSPQVWSDGARWLTRHNLVRRITAAPGQDSYARRHSYQITTAGGDTPPPTDDGADPDADVSPRPRPWMSPFLPPQPNDPTKRLVARLVARLASNNTVPALKAMARERGLPVSGTKTQLAYRIAKHRIDNQRSGWNRSGENPKKTATEAVATANELLAKSTTDGLRAMAEERSLPAGGTNTGLAARIAAHDTGAPRHPEVGYLIANEPLLVTRKRSKQELERKKATHGDTTLDEEPF